MPWVLTRPWLDASRALGGALSDGLALDLSLCSSVMNVCRILSMKVLMVCDPLVKRKAETGLVWGFLSFFGE